MILCFILFQAFKKEPRDCRWKILQIYCSDNAHVLLFRHVQRLLQHSLGRVRHEGKRGGQKLPSRTEGWQLNSRTSLPQDPVHLSLSWVDTGSKLPFSQALRFIIHYNFINMNRWELCCPPGKLGKKKNKNLKGALNIQKTSNLPSVLEEKNASCIDYQTVSEDVA